MTTIYLHALALTGEGLLLLKIRVVGFQHPVRQLKTIWAWFNFKMGLAHVSIGANFVDLVKDITLKVAGPGECG
jgi:hypothetical protein